MRLYQVSRLDMSYAVRPTYCPMISSRLDFAPTLLKPPTQRERNTVHRLWGSEQWNKGGTGGTGVSLIGKKPAPATEYLSGNAVSVACLSGIKQSSGMNKTFTFSALFVSLLLASCGGDDGSPTAPTPIPVATSITLAAASVSLASLGATSQLSATVKDASGATMASAVVIWTTSDTGVRSDVTFPRGGSPYSRTTSAAA